MTMNDPPPETSAEERLTKLKQSIAQGAARREQANTEAKADAPTGDGLAMSAGFRVATELVANVCVGALIGWQFDRWAGTSPILLLVFLLLGVASGFWSVYRIAMRPPKPRD